MQNPHDPEPLENISPGARYKNLLQRTDLIADHNQQLAIDQLDQLYWNLQKKTPFSLLKEKPQNLFLWGQVGIGKTFLMDLFFDSLPQKNKLRLHFHRFMALIHQELKIESGHKDPLIGVARRLYKKFQVLCLDELFITDIGDGMILYRLLEELFKQGMILVTTSNFPVDKLYKDDLQPEIFDPAIQLLRSETHQIHLDGNRDYRLEQAHPQQTYFLQEEKKFSELYSELCSKLNINTSTGKGDKPNTETLNICRRPIRVIRNSSQLAWFNFGALCYGPRSQLDYIEIANRFTNILLSEVPILGGKPRDQIKARGTEDGSVQIDTGERKVFYALEDNAARRFISLVDALYDNGVNLYLSAAVPLESLYIGDSLSFEFKRTQSRLIEMQSIDYLQQTNSRGVSQL